MTKKLLPPSNLNNDSCPQCDGSGLIFFRPPIDPVTCDWCKGTGKAYRNEFWIMQGLQLKDWRISKELTLREAARKYKIDASNLSKMERGLIKPDPDYLRMTKEKF